MTEKTTLLSTGKLNRYRKLQALRCSHLSTRKLISNYYLMTIPKLGPTDGQPSGPGPESLPSPYEAILMPKVIIAPGLEFDPARKFRYGVHSLVAALLIFVSFILVEMRNCNWGPGIDLDRLQALHVSLMIFAFVVYLLSLFGIADYIFQFKCLFLGGLLTIYVFIGLMLWMTYEAAVNPCVRTLYIPIDASIDRNKNVFSRGDTVGIMVLLLDAFATILMVSAACNFYKRH